MLHPSWSLSTSINRGATVDERVAVPPQTRPFCQILPIAAARHLYVFVCSAVRNGVMVVVVNLGIHYVLRSQNRTSMNTPLGTQRSVRGVLRWAGNV